MMKVVLSYSGGLDTTTCIYWIKEKYGADVVTVTVDVGQEDDFVELEERAYRAGALKHYTIDAKEEFAKKYILPGIKSNALYEGKYPLSTSLARPLISEKVVEIAKKEGTFHIAHGSTGKGNDQVRFEISIKSLYPEAKVFSPVREWSMSRDMEYEYLLSHGFKYPYSKGEFSVDENLWGRSVEGGRIELENLEPPEEAFSWTKNIKEAPDIPDVIEIEFEEGEPIGINGNSMDLVSIIKYLNIIGGKHGIGRIDHMEDRVVGIKSREVYEVPAAKILIEAHQDLEKLVLTKSVLKFKYLVEKYWTDLVYEGLWHDPLRESLDAFVNETQRYVSGKVKLKLFKGNIQVIGRESPNSLYKHNLSTYSSLSTFDQSKAIGFIEIWGMQTLLFNEMKVKPQLTKTENVPNAL
jgi:argininosuccinate synthase